MCIRDRARADCKWLRCPNNNRYWSKLELFGSSRPLPLLRRTIFPCSTRSLGIAVATTSDLEEELVRLSAGAGESRRTVIDLTVERLRQMAHRMLRKYPGVGRFDSTDDILGNAAIRLHQSLHVVKPDSARKYWGFAALQIRRTLICLLYTSPSPRDRTRSRMPSSA